MVDVQPITSDTRLNRGLLDAYTEGPTTGQKKAYIVLLHFTEMMLLRSEE